MLTMLVQDPTATLSDSDQALIESRREQCQVLPPMFDTLFFLRDLRGFSCLRNRPWLHSVFLH